MSKVISLEKNSLIPAAIPTPQIEEWPTQGAEMNGLKEQYGGALKTSNQKKEKTMIEINTLDQAELVLRRNNLVINELVEGKSLLDICGYSYTEKNYGQRLQRQVIAHNFIENRDFYLSTINGGKGRPQKIWEFTVDAANHVLLSAMTPEGKRARQEAIEDRKAKQRSEKGINWEMLYEKMDEVFGHSIFSTLNSHDQDQRVSAAEKRIEDIEHQLEDPTNRIHLTEPPEGYACASVLQEFIPYSFSFVKKTIRYFKLTPVYYITQSADGERYPVRSYNIEDFMTAAELVEDEAKQISRCYKEHPIVGRFRNR
ncbi:hypothetical protein [Endozoicomonas atrinae]|uniref:hypothetical protein n=1 Tax=Endozoicomonas atrinae TaxID=1333660 RepID=UPI0008267DD2|nr:hypothetical protein [Endozoicomonas atrinae]